MNEDIKAVNDAVKLIGDATGWQMVGAITAAGTIAMAMLQVVKDLTPLRRIFQCWWISGWIAAHVVDFNQNREAKSIDPTALRSVSAERTQKLLVELATGGDDHAFYELAIEQMVAQMNAAVQITLDYPRQFYDLLAVMSEGAELVDVATVVANSSTGARAKKASPSGNYLEARARVSHRIQRNLDSDTPWAAGLS